MEQQNKRFSSNSEKLNTDKSKFNKLFDESYKFLCETSSDAIFHISKEGTIISANPASIELCGYSHEELLGIKIWTLFPEREKSFFDSPLKEEISKYELKFIRKDGSSVILETHIRCLNDSTFQVIGKPSNKNIGFSDLDVQRLEILLQMY